MFSPTPKKGGSFLKIVLTVMVSMLAAAGIIYFIAQKTLKRHASPQAEPIPMNIPE